MKGDFKYNGLLKSLKKEGIMGECLLLSKYLLNKYWFIKSEMKKLKVLTDRRRLILHQIPVQCCYSTSIYEAVAMCKA